MFACMYNWLLRIDLLDRILLIILIVSVIAKAISEFICWYLCKKHNTDRKHQAKCVYLKSVGMEQDCNLNKCKNKFFIGEKCNKKRCPGYRTSNHTIDEIKQIYKFPFISVTLLKWISELTTILLVIRTLLNNSL